MPVKMFCRGLRKPWLTALAVFLAVRADASWQVSTVGSESRDFLGVAVGDGRNSGSGENRIYAGNRNGNVYEYYWNGTGWNKYTFGVAPDLSENRCVSLADLHNDGALRLAVGNTDNQVYDCRYSGGNWAIDHVLNPSGSSVQSLDAGMARNTSVVRIYFGNTTGEIFESRWNGSSWNSTVLSNSLFGNIWALKIGAGRNAFPGVNYLYASDASQNIYEFYYNGSGWTQPNKVSLASDVYSLAVGTGRNQDIRQFLYAGESNGQIVEYLYSAGWSSSPVADVTYPVYALAIGDGRNDGIQRLYAACGRNHLVELTWNGSSWDSLDLGGPVNSSAIYVGLALGAGRNNGLNSLYVSSNDNYFYEFRYIQDTPVPTETSTRTGTRTPAYTPTETSSPTSSLTATPTVTPTRSSTPIRSATPTYTRSLTYTITPTVTHSPTASLTPTLFIPRDLDHLVVYPNPYRADKNIRGKISFYLLPPSAEIRIYTLAGSLVWKSKKQNPDNQILWDLTNSEGAAVASGTYLYLVQAGGDSRRGKLSILR